jgi:hypothetical protein
MDVEDGFAKHCVGAGQKGEKSRKTMHCKESKGMCEYRKQYENRISKS